MLDCADWHIVQYLRARGELPVLSALIESGHRAVLDSDPPLTASAMEALVWPRRRSQASFVGLLHQLGVELAGLASVGDNPLGALEWLLPEDRDLFATLGADQLAAANLLFAHGGIQAGRHSEVTGPNGRHRRIPLATSARDLDAAERERWPALAAVREERDAIHLRTIAAEFDAAEQIVRAGEVDLFALRIEPLDILTHAHFAAAVRDGQDDGRGLLFAVYRYIDARLGAVHDLLDGDDVLIAMSDHGIRTAMEHSRQAIFVAAGPGVPPGRAAGTPELRGVARTLADLLGVASDWPDTGVAPWAGSRNAACRRRGEARSCSRHSLNREQPLARVALACLFGVVGISFAAIFVRLALPAPPVVTGFYRMLFASLLVGGFLLVAPRPGALPRRAARLAVVAGLCFGTDIALWHTAIVQTSVATATLLVNTTPVHVGLFTVLVLGQTLHARFVGGAALALLGCAVLLGISWDDVDHAQGAVLALCASLFYAGYLLLMTAARREERQRRPSLRRAWAPPACSVSTAGWAATPSRASLPPRGRRWPAPR